MRLCEICSKPIHPDYYWTFDDEYHFCSEECALEAADRLEESIGIYGLCKVELKTL